jgi:hypothetical protein
MGKLAVLQVADAGPLESLVLMLHSVGYDCVIPNEALRRKLKEVFGSTGLVLGPRDLTRAMGYDPVDVPERGPEVMSRCDLYVDVKAHQVHGRLVREWPRLEKRVLWYRINGGKPEHVIRKDAEGKVTEDCGDELDPPCPVLTPNQWYAIRWKKCGECGHLTDANVMDFTGRCDGCGADKWLYQSSESYACWPPFVRKWEYDPYVRSRLTLDGYTPPICLIHNVGGWGYRDAVDGMRKLGVKVYGQGSPDGLLSHAQVKKMMHTAQCMVHLKSSDAPGYAIYEAMAAGCPIVCTGRLVWRCRMQELLRPGFNCLTFDDRETHDGLTPAQVEEDLGKVSAHLEFLKDPVFNQRLGNRARAVLDSLLWDPQDPDDVLSLTQFMGRNFGG